MAFVESLISLSRALRNWAGPPQPAITIRLANRTRPPIEERGDKLSRTAHTTRNPARRARNGDVGKRRIRVPIERSRGSLSSQTAGSRRESGRGYSPGLARELFC